MSEIDTTQAMAKRASVLMQHYHGQLNNPIIMCRMLLLEGVFDEQDCYEVTRETSISGQNDAFNKALEKAVDDYDKLIIFAVILLKYKTTVHIGKKVLKECGKPFEKLETVHTKVQEVSLDHEDKIKDKKRQFLQLFIEMKKEIEKKHIPMDKLRSFLSFSFLELGDQLETAESIEELLTIISIHTSFLNVLHLKDIACHYRLQTVIELLLVYNDTLEEMSSEMLVKELYEQTLMPNSNRPLLQSECVKFTLNCSIGEESFCYIQRMLTTAFRRMAHHIMAKTVLANEDRVYLLCYAPLHLCGELMSLATKNEDELVNFCVVGVSIAGCVVINREELLVKENSKQLLDYENIESTTVDDGIQSESEWRRENAILWPKLEWYRMIEAKELELRTLTDEYSKYKQSCELIQSEIIKLQQVESSVTLQLQMNEQAISHLNEQIEKKHQKVLDDSKTDEQKKLDYELYEAVYSNTISDVEKLLKNNANPNSYHSSIYDFQETSLHSAVKRGNVEIPNLLISYGSDVHLRDQSGDTPLHYASRSGNVDIVNILLAHGGAVHTVNKYGKTPLDIAKGDEVIEAIKKQQMKDKALIEALSKNNHEDIEKSIKNGGNKKLQNLDEALYVAMEMNCFDVIEGLVKNGANSNICDRNKMTPLHWASLRGHIDTVTTLLAHGGDVEAQDKNKFTPLHFASRDGHSQIVTLLLSQRGNVNAKTNDENTPLHYASYCGHSEVVKKLLLYGAHVNAKDWDDSTPLHDASGRGHDNVVNIIISRGGDLYGKDIYESTPLHKASEDGHTNVVKTLISHGGEIHAKDKFGNRPLDQARLYHNQEVIEIIEAQQQKLEGQTK